jgi:hypothetical protein
MINEVRVRFSDAGKVTLTPFAGEHVTPGRGKMG